MTWKDIVRLEPRLADLLKEAQTVDGSGEHFCANRIWYGTPPDHGMKGRLQYLVGLMAANPKLRTSEAYDLAYQTIYRALPDCRRCMCL